MAVTSLRHWMLHNDRLADEYEQILDLSPAYDPVRAIDPHLTLSAPLLTGPDSLIQGVRGIVGRNSEATYWAPRGAFLLSAAAFESRHEYTPNDEPLGVLMEPASTNKCENYNANPDVDLTNVSKGGDAAASLTRVNDAAALAAAGLQKICASGFVFRLDNTLGSSSAWASIAGAAGNTNPHYGSVYWRGSGNGQIGMILPGSSQALPISYERFVEPLAPPAGGAVLQIIAEAGADLYFVLNQLEEQPVPSSVIVTEGAATSRAVDSLEWPNNGQHQIVNQAEGMLACVIRNLATPIDAAPPTGNNSNYAAGVNDLLTGDYMLRMEVSAPISRLYSRAFNASAGLQYINVQITDDPPGRDYIYALRWNRALTQFEVGVKDSGVWDRDQNDNYDRFSQSEIDSLGIIATAHGFQTRLYNVWDVDRGFDWIEDLCRGIAE